MRILILLIISLLASNTAFGSSVVIENHSDWDIHYLYLSPTDDDTWGPDQLGENVLDSGSQFKLKGVECDTYDVRIVDEDDDECVLSGISMCIFKEHIKITNKSLLSCQDKTMGDGGGGNQQGGTMTLYNASDWDIHELYVSSSNQANWGDDILGSNIWDSGESYDIWNLECGDYDMRMVDEDGDVCEVSEMFLCGDEGTMTLTNDILLSCQGNQ